MSGKSKLSPILSVLAMALLSALSASPAAAQDRADSAARVANGSGTLHSAAPVAAATPLQAQVDVDGVLEEVAWAAATPVTDFTQTDPVEGAPATERTEVRILYDAEALYVGARLYDSGPVTTRLARRDAMVPDSDFFIVLLDSYHDHRTAYRFATNPSGMKRDEIVTGGADGGGPGRGGGFGDTSWDPIWQVASAVTDSGWVAEMRIPFSQLRFSPEDLQTWGIQIERKINRKQEQLVFAFTPKLERGGVARYGHLEGISGIRPGNRLELLPYVGGRAEFREINQDAAVDFSNPFRSDSEVFGGAGVDLKYRISSNVTLDATLNPDFGQVEVDPAVLNLTAFETRFDEKRPFFVEGAEIFRFGGGGGGGGGRFGPGGGTQLLYSRRIGRNPQGDIPDAAIYSEMPSATTILGAAKLTGKTADGWSAGLLNAVTGREQAPYVDDAGFQREAVVEPLSNYLVGRLRRDLRAGETYFGGIATAVNRSLDAPELAQLLRSGAYAVGGDFRHEWAGRSWALNGQLSSSYITGEDEAITRTQRSSARYYQRPDAEYLQVDSAATSLTGYSAKLEVEKQAGEWQGGVAVTSTSPGYEINDLGFQTAADRVVMETTIRYEQTVPGRYFRRWGLTSGPDLTWNHGGDIVDADVSVFGSAQFANYWNGGIRLGYEPSTLNDRLTRGGPLARDLAGYSGFANINTDSRKSYTVRGGLNLGWDEAGAWSRGVDVNVGLKLNDKWEVRVGPDVSFSRSAAQYVSTITDPAADHTFGRRYVFADLEQTTVGIETRVNVTFTPGLSFELFAQPFLSSGDYGSLKELAAPRTFDFLTYGSDVGSVARTAEGEYVVDPDGAGPSSSFGIDDRDFTVRSLRGNAVLRWEWSPGSTVYLVWQQERYERLDALGADPAYQQIGNFDFGRDSRELFGIRPDNVFLIKVNYWLNP